MQYQPRAFKWRHFQGDVILQCVRWYCKYGISYRDLEEMMAERGVRVDHTTLYRWVQHYAPELKKKVEWYQNRCCNRWFLDETYGAPIFWRLHEVITRTLSKVRIQQYCNKEFTS